MDSLHWRAKLRFAVPQVFTALRVVIGGWALFAAVLHEPELAAKLLVVGVITDVLDGTSARLLGVISVFGGLFDWYSDYLYYIVVPGVICLMLTEAGQGPYAVLILGLPFLTGAIRYARNFSVRLKESPQNTDPAGLGTNVYTFFVVALVFLKRDGVVQAATLAEILLYTVPVFSVLMITPIRYPRLVKHNWVLISVLVGLNLMPFVLSVPLAILTLSLIALYVLFSPLIFNRQPIPDGVILSRSK